jgi:CRP-like cAMP-binding protein
VTWSRDGPPCANLNHIVLPMSRGEIADYLGLTIETVSRTFTRLRLDKRISTPVSSEVIFLDRRWLEDVAAGVHEKASPLI